MSGEAEACEECSRNCLLIHKKHNPSLTVSSFFKVMFGKHFSSVVMLPPRFVKLTSLVPKETYLEDTCGRKWYAIICDIDGSLAIQRGWNEFLVDHGIQVGEFVIFHYIFGSHFLVQIYGIHGCEKLSLYEENAYPNKRAKSTNDSISTNACSTPELEMVDSERQDELNDVQESVMVKRDASSKVKTTECLNIVPPLDFVDDAHFLINDQEHPPREDDRDHLFDLSIFEMPKNSQVFDALQKPEIRTASNSCITKKRRSTEAITLSKNQEVFMSKKEYNPSSTCPRVGTPLSSNTPLRGVGMSSNSEFLVTPGGKSSLVVKQEPKVQTPDFISKAMTNISPGINQQKVLCSNMPYKSALEVQNPGLSAPLDYCQPPGVNVEMVKQELQELSQNLSGNVNLGQTDGGNLNENLYCMKNDDSKVGITAKLEPVDLCDPSSMAKAKITCSVLSDSEPFLELPECLPTRVAKFQSLPVLLQDPLGRLWPVLYLLKFGVKALASGWKSFRDANNIQPGDECTFIIECVEESRFLVEILRGKTPE